MLPCYGVQSRRWTPCCHVYSYYMDKSKMAQKGRRANRKLAVIHAHRHSSNLNMFPVGRGLGGTSPHPCPGHRTQSPQGGLSSGRRSEGSAWRHAEVQGGSPKTHPACGWTPSTATSRDALRSPFSPRRWAGGPSQSPQVHSGHGTRSFAGLRLAGS